MRQRHIPSNPDHDKLVKLSWNSVTRLIKLAAPYKGTLAVAAILMLISAAASVSLPLFLRLAIDQVITTHALRDLNLGVVVLLAIVTVSSVCSFTQYVLVARAGNRIVMELRERLFAHLQRLQVSFFDRSRSGDLTSHLSNDVGLVQQTLTSDVASFLPNLVTLVGGVIVAFVLNWELCLVVVGMLVLMMAFFVIFGRRLRKLTREALDALSDTMGGMTEALANIRLVKAFARETHEDERAHTKLEKVFGLSMKTSVAEAAMGMVASSGFFLFMIGIMWFGARSIIVGNQSPASLVAFFAAVFIIVGPMGSLASLYTRLQRAVGAADRLFEILDETPEEVDSPVATAFPPEPGDVLFSRIEFAYVPEVPVLTGLSLRLPSGKVTAIVGQSGSGKTTLSSLLYRFYEPQAGSIEIGDVPIRNIRRQELREHIGLVPQDTILFNATIRENIRYGRLMATNEEVEAAARAANVEEFVAGLPEGYDTLIGERGITLSGGQRQRVAIARVLLKDPAILILDEATSALDTRSEALVREALERAMNGRTTMIIAHRLSTIQHADQIAVLDDGRIVEIGKHEELLAKGGRYAELHNLMPQG